jgi:hypothetical protein
MPEEIVARVLHLPDGICAWEAKRSGQHADPLDPPDGRGTSLRLRGLRDLGARDPDRLVGWKRCVSRATRYRACRQAQRPKAEG